MRRDSCFKRVIDSDNFKTAMSILSGLGIIVLCLLGFSFLLTFFDANDAIKSVMSALSLCIGSFWAGFYCARQKRHRGILNGLFCGLCIYFAIFLIGTIILNITANASVFTKIILACLLSAAGGVVGVNSKHNYKISKPKKKHFDS